MNYNEAIGVVRVLIDSGIPRDAAVNNPAIPEEFRERIREELQAEEIITLEPARLIIEGPGRDEWLKHIDRSEWYYWPTLRQFLLVSKNWQIPVIRSLDAATDRILGQLSSPSTEQFDIRGLVLGYVQSGKTENYTALIAKAADVGYRLIIVLSGIDNGLRLQTQIRLKGELVGYPDKREGAVSLPPLGKQWHEYTIDDINGDFRPGNANPAALQGPQPVLLVIKKNGTVLRRLLHWLDNAPSGVKNTIPVLVIDDEADQASIDTRGTYTRLDEPPDNEYEPPSVINRLIRQLLQKFSKTAYVAYTATPFANILIPHDASDPEYHADLFPKDFIIDLPKPRGYFGAEELFGIIDSACENGPCGLDVVRDVPDEDLITLEGGILPPSLEEAVFDFILAGAARSQRMGPNHPATMLIHVSRLIEEQSRLSGLIEERFQGIRDEWRYQRQHGIQQKLMQRWEDEFRPVIRSNHSDVDVPFEVIEPSISHFLESVVIRTINSETGEVLDYQREPNLKTIAIGGDRLSRGLTLEGLLVSFFTRPTTMYDTLMQMGRWFGFRQGYEDLTRIYMTDELAGFFSDLAIVEHQLREDISIYENLGLTPYTTGMRILQHPSMQVTSQLKRRYSTELTISQSYSGKRAQTFKFPLTRPDLLEEQEQSNLQLVREFISGLGTPEWQPKGPVWKGIDTDKILSFLSRFRSDTESGLFSPELIRRYIEKQNEQGELIRWTLTVRMRESAHQQLGEADWGIPGGRIWNISRTRLKDTESLGVITNPGDEAIGLTPDELERMNEVRQLESLKRDLAARRVRSPEEGLVLLYPISRYSGHERNLKDGRRPLYDNPNSPESLDLIGLAISFPESENSQPVEAYLTGTAGWRPVE